MYSCSNCDTQYIKWQGRCNECGHWGSLKIDQNQDNTLARRPMAQVGKIELTSVLDLNIAQTPRHQSRLPEFDALLGGGMSTGSLVLLAGEPGIGKSTFVLQLINSLKEQDTGLQTLYLAGEESPEQIKSRLERLQIKPDIKLLRQPTLEQAVAAIGQNRPGLVVVDSIQTLASTQIDSSAGSINQIRACAASLLETCKKQNTTCFIIGQVTKDGLLAGPKTLEHLVDTVIYLEGDAINDYRMLRVTKNRFGPTDEVMVMKMTPSGFEVIANPSMIFLDSPAGTINRSGVITPVADGSKTFLIEIQALVTPTNFGYPQRRSSGFDNNRLQLLLAVLSKQAKLPQLNNHDVHLNIAGGYKVIEPAADLGVCLAITASLLNKEFTQAVSAFGEVGLSGEIRPVKRQETRLKELNKAGIQKIISPATVRSISEAINTL